MVRRRVVKRARVWQITLATAGGFFSLIRPAGVAAALRKAQGRSAHRCDAVNCKRGPSAGQKRCTHAMPRGEISLVTPQKWRCTFRGECGGGRSPLTKTFPDPCAIKPHRSGLRGDYCVQFRVCTPMDPSAHCWYCITQRWQVKANRPQRLRGCRCHAGSGAIVHCGFVRFMMHTRVRMI